MENNFAFHRFARALRDYFANEPYETEVVLLLLLPTFLILVYLFFKMRHTKRRSRFPTKDLEFFQLVCLQKGLEEFERIILLNLVEIFGIKPMYQVLLDKTVFQTLTNRLKKERPADLPPRANAENLLKLGKKLFPNESA